MSDYIELAKTYGGFTSLDKHYLERRLDGLSDSEKLAFITPPPSVINAYFAEIYQKQSLQAATDYYFDLSKALDLFQTAPSFLEEKPFVRLNLFGKSYGFAYENDNQVAIIFAEEDYAELDQIAFELAQIFPHYVIYEENQVIKMKHSFFSEEAKEDITPDDWMLSHLYRLKDGTLLLQGFNSEELIELSQSFSEQKYYAFSQREFRIYISN
ncbi:cystathionine beta-lyase [Streptococcus ictaluri]|uniref:Cystathionine beta-lyase n=1 Tax=Streptococcus ictaluri 707-05 TaxID=764299 RepID=G5K696_9STRE|nr:hypothetical protein [Streptococcus ictaluri]EHI68605.1 hypothetical protein STRIC_0583 [Streptococcus ictaluri 707-05]